jgi:ketosteroid isomerase-like protein
MTDKKFEEMIRDYVDALEKNDVSRALSFFSDDAVWYNPKGVYKGTKELTEYLTWLFAVVSDMKFVDDGVGVMVQGNKGVYQHILECTVRGTKKKVPTFCTYLFNGQKCEIHRTIKAADPSISRGRR